MEKHIEEINKIFPKLKTEIYEQRIIFQEGVRSLAYIYISNLNGNSDLKLVLNEEKDIEEFKKMPLNEIFIFNDYLASFHNNIVEVILSEVSFKSIIYEDRIQKSPIEIKLNYKKSDLKINIHYTEDITPLRYIARHIRGSQRYRFKKGVILTIENLSNVTLDKLESEVKLILNSILFDIEHNFNLSYETVNINSIQRKVRRKPKPRYEIPSSTLELSYKKYIPELIDYFHTGEKVDYLPFKFVCYFHIIEYFQDKSAFFIVREKLKQIMQKPDFSLNINNYASQALNLIKLESEKHQTDKIKIQRVFKQFIDIVELREFLEDVDLFDYFSKDCTMEFSKPLILPALDFSSEIKFIETLTNRIYSIRCSIVHSNPDFDDKKAVPFLATFDNLDKLRNEIELIMEVAKTIILKSA